jgi:CBS domain-containing protein
MDKVHDLLRAKGHEVHSVPASSYIAEVAQKFLETGVSSFLVYEQDVIVGIFTKNDIIRRCCYAPADWENRPISQFMSTNLFTVGPDTSLEDAFHQMIQKGHHHLPVMQGGKAIGMITPFDILLHQQDKVLFENAVLIRYIYDHR